MLQLSPIPVLTMKSQACVTIKTQSHAPLVYPLLPRFPKNDTGTKENTVWGLWPMSLFVLRDVGKVLRAPLRASCSYIFFVLRALKLRASRPFCLF